MNIKPIKCAADHEAALARIAELMDAEAGTAEGDELDVLATLVEAYEEKHFPVDAPDPIAAIKFRMEQQGLRQADIVRFIGSRPRVSEILSGSRSLTLPMIRRLHKGLKIPLEALIKDAS